MRTVVVLVLTLTFWTLTECLQTQTKNDKGDESLYELLKKVLTKKEMEPVYDIINDLNLDDVIPQARKPPTAPVTAPDPSQNGYSSCPKARTKSGVIKGHTVLAPQGDVKVDEYLGIPFAAPPIGKLRFKDPEPYGKFPGGEYIADNMQYSCIQVLDTTFGTFRGSHMWNAPNPLNENCLFLNIWVPRPRKEKRAVMVWIYGGGFYGGSNALWVYDGKALAAHTDVIVVSINYRVGTFGFLSTGDDQIKGNFGLKDQVMALQWIRDNIAAFGGDPDLVTLFGESAGAASVGFHMMSSYSEKLFKRAIFESGSSDSHWAYMTKEQAKSRSDTFLSGVNCNNAENLIECLQDLDASFIHENEWVTGQFLEFPWAPAVDGDFLTDTPHNLLKAGKFQKKDSLLGVNKDEGTFWILYTLPGFSKDNSSLQTYMMFRNGVDTIDWDLSPDTRNRIKDIYTPDDKSDLAANRDQLDKVCGDRSFTCPTIELADIYSEQGIKTYFYYLTHRASNEVWPPWMGVIHGADVQWVFGMPLNDSRNYKEEEKQFSRDIMDYWANFAKYGDPNGEGLAKWPEHTASKPVYLELRGPSDFPTNTTLRDSYCPLWKEINKNINEGKEG